MKIGIAGDSFSCQLPPQGENHGWPLLLSNAHEVTNISSCGSSEYRIWMLLQEQRLEDQDAWIVSHTSHSRVYVPFNPLHQDTPHHQQCDVLYTDIEHRRDSFSRACQGYFRHLFDDDYHRNIHTMLFQQIQQMFGTTKVLHITHFDYSSLTGIKHIENFHDFWCHHRGDVNHYSARGNRTVYERIQNWIQSI